MQPLEGSRGEFGVFLESQGDKMPYRLHYRATGLPLVAAIDTICRGAKIADLIAIGGTLDYVVPISTDKQEIKQVLSIKYSVLTDYAI